MRLKSGAQVATFRLDQLDPRFERAEVRFEGLTLPARSFELRVFLDDPAADARTPTKGNPHYLGTQYFFGAGSPHGAPGGAAPAAPNRQLAPTAIRLNVSDRLRAFLEQTGKKQVPVTLVAVDRDGNEIADPGLAFAGVSLVTS